MSKHTPGPWTMDRNGWKFELTGRYHRIISADKFPTAFIPAWSEPSPGEVDGTDEANANAHLIEAAPDLLAVAQFFLRGIEGGHIKCASYIDFDPNAEMLEIKSPAERLREAIAKALGAAPTAAAPTKD